MTDPAESTVEALIDTASRDLSDGRLTQARLVLEPALPKTESPALPPTDVDGGGGQESRLRALILFGRILVVHHLVARAYSADQLNAVGERALQIAQSLDDANHLAAALELRGQAGYVTHVVDCLRRGASLYAVPGDGQYDQVCDDHVRALGLRRELNDTRGISESLFAVGLMHERWRQFDRAQTCYREAYGLAEQGGHAFEMTEPARHVAIQAYRDRDLDEALTLARRALSLREASGFRPYQPLDHLLIKDIALAQGDLELARHHVRQANAHCVAMDLPALITAEP